MNGLIFYYDGYKIEVEVSRKYESKCCGDTLFFFSHSGRTNRRCIMVCGACTEETTGIEK